MTFHVPIESLRWTTQHISPAHLEPHIVNTEPILVSEMNDGNWFVHDGRHRTIRAHAAGVTHLPARLLT